MPMPPGRPASSVRDFPCPPAPEGCGAAIGEPCTLSGRYHAARYRAAGKAPPKGGPVPGRGKRGEAQRRQEIADAAGLVGATVGLTGTGAARVISVAPGAAVRIEDTDDSVVVTVTHEAATWTARIGRR